MTRGDRRRYDGCVRVLIVDDSAIVRDRLASAVGERPGIELMQATGADEALAIASRGRPDVVLLDFHMPGRSGLAVIADLKAMSPPPVVVVLTWQPTEAHRRKCLSMGADFFFDKAFDFSRVLQSVIGSDEPRGPV